VAKPTFDSLSPKNIAVFSFLLICFFVCSRLGTRLPFVQPYSRTIWLPAGCAIAAFILFGYRIWPAVLVGSILGHVTVLGLVRASFEAPVAATMEGIIGSYLVNKFAHGVKAFDTSKDVIRFLFLACICATAIDIPVAFQTNYFIRHHNFTDSCFMVLHWWLAHCIGVLVVAPFFILLIRGSHHRLDLPEVVELTFLIFGLISVSLLVFGPLSTTLNKAQIVSPYMFTPFLVWAAFRFCPLEAAGATFVLFASAIWGTLHGYGQFVSPNHAVSLTLLDTFVGVNGAMTLIVAAVVAERRRSAMELLAVQSLLHAAVDAKNRELAMTVTALEKEAAVHALTRKSLRDNQERLRLRVESQERAQ
jgi:integral membrane sensor domain MASE1